MNRQLILDEGHRNRAMSLEQLAERMRGFLNGAYEAVLFEEDGRALGYALFRMEPEHVYLRQFFIRAELRRRGLGREAMQWLMRHHWGGRSRVRLEVLVGNTAGIAFWRACGFRDYCVTMEQDLLSARHPQ
jgi:ribosomal protein S18 acetylase RimI-like enzyme